MNFTIEAGQTIATFAGTPAYQSGTVAGTIMITMTQLQAGGQSYVPNPDPTTTHVVHDRPVGSSNHFSAGLEGVAGLQRADPRLLHAAADDPGHVCFHGADAYLSASELHTFELRNLSLVDELIRSSAG